MTLRREVGDGLHEVAVSEKELLDRVVTLWLALLEQDEQSRRKQVARCVGGVGCSECHAGKEHGRGFPDNY